MRLECFMASNSPDRNLAPHMSLPPAKPEQGRYGMSVENTAKTQVMSSQPSSLCFGVQLWFFRTFGAERWFGR